MLSTQPNPLFSVAEIGVLNCPGCGNPMRLAPIEPDKPGKCGTGESFLVAI
jgi:hypothetical protein